MTGPWGSMASDAPGQFTPNHGQETPNSLTLLVVETMAVVWMSGPCSLLFPLIVGPTLEVGWHFPGLRTLETLPWVCSGCGVGIRDGGI